MYHGTCVDKFCVQEQNGQGREFSQTEYADADENGNCEEAFYHRRGLNFPSKRCPTCRQRRNGCVNVEFVCEVCGESQVWTREAQLYHKSHTGEPIQPTECSSCANLNPEEKQAKKRQCQREKERLDLLDIITVFLAPLIPALQALNDVVDSSPQPAGERKTLNYWTLDSLGFFKKLQGKIYPNSDGTVSIWTVDSLGLPLKHTGEAYKDGQDWQLWKVDGFSLPTTYEKKLYQEGDRQYLWSVDGLGLPRQLEKIVDKDGVAWTVDSLGWPVKPLGVLTESE